MRSRRGWSLYLAVVLAGLTATLLGVGLPIPAAQGASSGMLEDPPPDVISVQSGIGLFRGWVCGAQIVEIQINDAPPFRVPYPSPRADVLNAGECGDVNSGFALQQNWNLLGGSGPYQVKLLADGQVVKTATVTVRFSPTSSGSFAGGVGVSSTGGMADVALTGMGE